MRGFAVILLALGVGGCGGRTEGNPTEPVSLDTGGATDGDAACAPGKQLCDVCGTLGCYSGPCPMHSCLVQATCPAELPEPGGSCDVDGIECGYETPTNACGADNCYCQGGVWNCGPTCVIPDAGPGAGGGCPSGTSLCTACGTMTGFCTANCDYNCPATGPCPVGETLCLEGCYALRPVCVEGSCPGPPPCDFEPDAATCPSGKVMCAACPGIPPACVDVGACVPDPSCPPAPPVDASVQPVDGGFDATGVDDANAILTCPEGELRCPTYCTNPGYSACVPTYDGGCPPPPFDCAPPK